MSRMIRARFYGGPLDGDIRMIPDYHIFRIAKPDFMPSVVLIDAGTPVSSLRVRYEQYEMVLPGKYRYIKP